MAKKKAESHTISASQKNAQKAILQRLVWDNYDQEGKLIKYPSYQALFEHHPKEKVYVVSFPSFGWGASSGRTRDEAMISARDLLRVLITQTYKEGKPLPKPIRSRAKKTLTRDLFMVSPQEAGLPRIMPTAAKEEPSEVEEKEIARLRKEIARLDALVAGEGEGAGEGEETQKLDPNPHAGTTLKSFLIADGSYDQARALAVEAVRSYKANLRAKIEEDPDSFDPVETPLHYLWHPTGIECNAIAQHFGANVARAISYLWRAEHKDSAVADYKKAIQYLEWEITRIKNFEESLLSVDEPLNPKKPLDLSGAPN